ncbi:hypothetical protein TELCIR_22126, partial [Teladorsagia circumcincta]
MGVETRRATAGGRHKKTTPPIFSHEFVIQNHGDIMSCVLMVFIVGLMFPLKLDGGVTGCPLVVVGSGFFKPIT